MSDNKVRADEVIEKWMKDADVDHLPRSLVLLEVITTALIDAEQRGYEKATEELA